MDTVRGILRLCGAAAVLAAAATTAYAQSLENEGGGVTVREVAVTASIAGRVARVTVEEVVANAGGGDGEALLLFPLPGGAAVDGLSLWIDGKETTGELLDDRRARGVYEGIVRRKKDPALLECIGDRLYRARVYPVPPGGERRVKISWNEILPGDAGSVTWTFPLRFRARSGAPATRVSVAVDVEAGRPLASVWSPSHPGTVVLRPDARRGGDRRARASWETDGELPDRDFVLVLQEPTDELGFTLLASRPAGEAAGTFLMVLSPSVAAGERPVPRDVVLCVDTSGSMAGVKLEQAKGAMKHAVRTLEEGDRFALIAFATEPRSFRPGLIPADAAAREAAEAWIDALSASGGTAIRDALLESLSRFDGEEERRGVLLFLTDGLPTIGETDGAKILEQVTAAARERVRGFVFGVGDDVNTWLLDSAARVLRGARDYVVPGEDIERKVSALVDKTRYPALTDLSLEVEGVAVSALEPRTLPDLFRGSELVLAGRYEGSGEAVVRVRAQARDGPRVFERKVDFPERAEGLEFVDRLWAVRRVGFLMDEIRLRGKDPELHAEVVALAKRHGIVTPFTARLVLEPGMDVAMDEQDSEATVIRENLGDPRFVSGAPFLGSGSNEGSGSNSDIGIGGGAGGMFGGRRGGHRNLLLQGGGGTEGATEPGLFWLQGRCDSEEGWGSARDNGLALLALLGYGETHKTPRYGREVRIGLKALKGLQEGDGCFGPRAGPGWFRGHLHAALAMNEAYGLTQSPLFKYCAQRGTDFILAARHRDGGWGEGAGTGPSDVLTTVLAVMALRSANSAGLEVEAGALEAAGRWLAGTDVRDRPAAAAAAVLGRIFAGADPGAPGVRDALVATLGAPPSTTDAEHWYFGTLAAFQLGGEIWRTWNGALKAAVIETQRTDRSMAESGSWDPLGSDDPRARFLTTAYNTLSLEVYYRYSRVFGTRDAAPAPRRAPPPEPAEPGVSGAEAVRRSLEAKRLAEATGTEAGGGPPVEGAVRVLGGRTFTLRGTTWWDGSVDPAAPRTIVPLFSDRWILLSRASMEARSWLSLGTVVVEIDGTVIEVGR